MFNLFPISYELFVRQRVYVYEFQLPYLTEISKILSKFIYFATHQRKYVYYPLLNIFHEWYRLKYHSAQEAVVNQAT